MQYSTRLPATPLITHDPYFSIWAPGDTPTAEDTVHWSGIRKILRVSILVDGVERGFLSRGLRQAMRCVDTRVTPLSTEYILEDLGVRLSVKFTSPLTALMISTICCWKPWRSWRAAASPPPPLPTCWWTSFRTSIPFSSVWCWP